MNCYEPNRGRGYTRKYKDFKKNHKKNTTLCSRVTNVVCICVCVFVLWSRTYRDIS